MAPNPKCEHCNEVIGVYEPMIVVVGEEVCETSRAAEPSVASGPGERYHRTCSLERPRAADAGALQSGRDLRGVG
jgi:hypothetical protein